MAEPEVRISIGDADMDMQGDNNDEIVEVAETGAIIGKQNDHAGNDVDASEGVGRSLSRTSFAE